MTKHMSPELFFLVRDASVLADASHFGTALFDAGGWLLSPSLPPDARPGTSAADERALFARRWNAALARGTAPLGAVVTTPEQMGIVADAACALYIPGEFCRQGDVLSAAARLKKPVLLERGAFLAPADLLRALAKLVDPDTGARCDVRLVDAGSSFGYSDRVLDPRALAVLSSAGAPWGVQLSDLARPETAPYAHLPRWLDEPAFFDAHVRTALAIGASLFVIKADTPEDLRGGHARLSALCRATP